MNELQKACSVVEDELKKHGEFYDAFVASIQSVLKPKEKYVGDGCFSIELFDSDSFMLAEAIANRIYGEE